jgi:hypothetical protein
METVSICRGSSPVTRTISQVVLQINSIVIQDRPTRLLSQGLSNVDKLWVNMQRVESVGPNGLTFYPTNLTSEAELRLWLNQTFGYTGTQIDRVLAAYPADQFANLTIRTQKLRVIGSPLS